MQAVAPGLFFLSSSISSENGSLIVKAIMLRMIGVAITQPSFVMMILVVGFTVQLYQYTGTEDSDDVSQRLFNLFSISNALFEMLKCSSQIMQVLN